MEKKIGKKDILELTEGYYLVNLLNYIYQQGLINPDWTIRHSGKVHKLLPDILDILYNRTNVIVKKSNGRYEVAPGYRHYIKLGFYFDRMLGAYGTFDFKNKQRLLSVNEKTFASAYEGTHQYRDFTYVITLLQAKGSTSILDLGCGMGRLITQFCEASPGNKGIGIDANETLCKKGNALLRKNKLHKRAHILYGDAYHFEKCLTAEMCASIDSIVASSFMNEFFEDDGKQLVSILSRLKKTFKGKTLIIMDYYGVLGTPAGNKKELQQNYVHDILQLLSGQGVPASSHKEWNLHYKKAGCRLTNVFEGVNNGINWFIHCIQL